MILSKLPRATFAQLRSFEAVARLGGVTKAAQALHLTQPTVSTQLRELADALGVPLLAPAGRGVQLTDAGRDLLVTVSRIFESWRAFEDTVADTQGMLRGALRIAGVTTTEYFLAQWLKPFVQAYPGIEIDLTVDNRSSIITRLERAQDDLTVMMMPPQHIALQHATAMDNPLVLVGPLGHPWAGTAKAPSPHIAPAAANTTARANSPRKRPLQLLSGADLLLREPGSGTRQATLDFLAAHQLAPRLRMTLGSNEAIKHAVAAGLGLAIVSQHALASDPAREGLAVLPMAGLPIQRTWQLVWRSDRRLPRSASVFIDFVKRHVAAQSMARPA
jgi:LysR family transcriptional regulator, low CO2-responsive transcriptional regulator